MTIEFKIKNLKLRINLILTAIIVIAVFLRFYQLSNVPPSASMDEASIGYNAYSILKTGADEYGTRFPILLRAYDDWRPALYAYLVAPFVKIFDLNVFAVRLPSVILSILAIVSSYYLVKALFDFSKHKTQLAFLASLLLAISPWHIYISRLGHEANAGLSFIIFAITFFAYWIKNKSKKWMLIPSSVFFALSLYTYQSEKVFVPLIILTLIVVFWREIFERKKEIVVAFLLGLIISLPIFMATLTPNGLIRLKGTSVFINNPLYQESAEKLLQYKKEGTIIGQFLANRRITTLKIFLTNYFSHYNPNFLFGNSGNEQFKAPAIGLLYAWEFPFIVLGLVFLFFKNMDRKTKTIIASWIIISFVAPALTTGAPHAMRAYNVLPVPQILTALGIIIFLNYLARRKLRLLLYLIVVIMVVSIVYYLSYFYKQYFFNFPKAQSSSFQYGLSKAIPFVFKQEKYYSKIIFSNRDNLYQSYMFFLFYTKYDPRIYQKLGGTVSGGFNESHKFGKYEFRPIIWSKDRFSSNTLLIGNTSEFPQSINAKNFNNLDGEGVIKVVAK